jgi:hypothetical protein
MWSFKHFGPPNAQNEIETRFILSRDCKWSGFGKDYSFVSSVGVSCKSIGMNP